MKKVVGHSHLMHEEKNILGSSSIIFVDIVITQAIHKAFISSIGQTG